MEPEHTVVPGQTILEEYTLFTCTKCKKELPLELKTKGRSRRCKSCHNKYANEWLQKNLVHQRWLSRQLRTSPERRASIRKSAKVYQQRLRNEVINAYGGKCTCCGECERDFLSLEHLNGDGIEHRRKVGGGGLRVWLDIKRRGFPKDNYTILCMNCNWGKNRMGGICPHELIKRGSPC